MVSDGTNPYWNLKQTHFAAGHEIAARIPTTFQGALQVLGHHHERWDETGSPDRLPEAAPARSRRGSLPFAKCVTH
ncbi:hypothetical protein GCM10008955_29640 [Deinococcus malanensis]|uniref:HD-GYP domain-containing protein n=1 Tax=Deinococcus malanensis TaxID=1706855 RepID=A0ABQ2F1Z5_9DEIO|nr:hypothetical protein GCM10008955_29640 [Deinococcus malanensis]